MKLLNLNLDFNFILGFENGKIQKPDAFSSVFFISKFKTSLIFIVKIDI